LTDLQNKFLEKYSSPPRAMKKIQIEQLMCVCVWVFVCMRVCMCGRLCYVATDATNILVVLSDSQLAKNL